MPVKVNVRVTKTVDVEVDVPESEIANGIREAIVEGVKRFDDAGKNDTGDLAGGTISGCRWLRAVLAALRT